MPKKTLTLSIVIPAYNEEDHLRACLDSIASQTVKPDEVIVVDNNSTDNTAKVAKEYLFVKLLKETRQGVVFARDKGFDSVKSDLIGRIDADTILPPGWVERILSFYSDSKNQNKALTGGAYFYNVRLGHAAGWFQGQIAFRINRLLMGHYILFGSNMVLPKSVWENVRSKVCHNSRIHEDLDLAIHVHRAGYEITYREYLKVGIKMRRVFEDRGELWENLELWPETLKSHGRWTWVFGWLGAALLYLTSFLFPLFRKK